MLTISEAFTYAGIAALHVGAVIDGVVWVHRSPFPEMRRPGEQNPELAKLLAAVRARGTIDPRHWEKLGDSSWRP